MAKRRMSKSTSREKKTISTQKAKLYKVRRSARLKNRVQLKNSSRRQEVEASSSSTAEFSQNQAQASTLRKPPLKRKRDQDIPCSFFSLQSPLPLKRPRTLSRHTVEEQLQDVEKPTSITIVDHLQSWVTNKTWPTEYFEPDDQEQNQLLQCYSRTEEIMAQSSAADVEYFERDGFRYPLPAKKTPSSLRRKQSDSSLTASSEQKKRESKSTPYRDPRYTILLEKKGSFQRNFNHKPHKTITDTCTQLLNKDQIVPQNTLFRDDTFSRLCDKIQDRNEAMIIQDVTRLIVPSAMNFAIHGDTNLDILIESINEAWISSIPVEGPRPQPDYAVGFDWSAFTSEQLAKLNPLIGSVYDTSLFVATYRMYFPFLTCEVKCGLAALDIADRQNAHSMTIAVRSVIELYRAVKREKELDREVLAFSISHDHSIVKIYGHYAVIIDSKTTFYRHLIKSFNFRSEDGADKWTCYKFTKSVYGIWMPRHLERILSAVDQLPSNLDFEVSDQPEAQSEATGLSQDMGSLLSDVGFDPRSSQENGRLDPQTATPDPSVSREMSYGAAKRAKKSRAQNKSRTSGVRS